MFAPEGEEFPPAARGIDVAGTNVPAAGAGDAFALRCRGEAGGVAPSEKAVRFGVSVLVTIGVAARWKAGGDFGESDCRFGDFGLPPVPVPVLLPPEFGLPPLPVLLVSDDLVSGGDAAVAFAAAAAAVAFASAVGEPIRIVMVFSFLVGGLPLAPPVADPDPASSDPTAVADAAVAAVAAVVAVAVVAACVVIAFGEFFRLLTAATKSNSSSPLFTRSINFWSSSLVGL